MLTRSGMPREPAMIGFASVSVGRASATAVVVASSDWQVIHAARMNGFIVGLSE